MQDCFWLESHSLYMMRKLKTLEQMAQCLDTLNLRECYWFESHSLLTLSKCEKLEELRLADCLLSDFVPYVSLGTRFGFKTLTVSNHHYTEFHNRKGLVVSIS
ncbi:hypothetical protein J6590_025410 [Homalodisca vitripennis]|nr:hypothetical protein J6590_025410 [Homalodisca vitripennis]